MKTTFEHPALEEPIVVYYEWEICKECKGEGNVVHVYYSDRPVQCPDCDGLGKTKRLHLPDHIIKVLQSYYESAAADRRYAQQERWACGNY